MTVRKGVTVTGCKWKGSPNMWLLALLCWGWLLKAGSLRRAERGGEWIENRDGEKRGLESVWCLILSVSSKRKKNTNKPKKTVALFRDNYTNCFLFAELREQKANLVSNQKARYTFFFLAGLSSTKHEKAKVGSKGRRKYILEQKWLHPSLRAKGSEKKITEKTCM